MWTILTFLIFLVKLSLKYCAEYTFNLPDNEKSCYYRELDKGAKTKIEFQVITGGSYDVDVVIIGPLNNQPIQHYKQKQFEEYEWDSTESGTHTVCFSNEFSTFAHKVIYFDWTVEGEDQFGGRALDPGLRLQYPLTRIDSSAEVIHENFNEVSEYQTHYRLSEASGRIFAEDLNNKVMVLSLSETLAVLIIGIGQIIVLRNFFTDKKIGSF